MGTTLTRRWLIKKVDEVETTLLDIVMNDERTKVVSTGINLVYGDEVSARVIGSCKTPVINLYVGV